MDPTSHDNDDEALFADPLGGGNNVSNTPGLRSDPLAPVANPTSVVPLQASLVPIEQVTPSQAVAAAMALMPQRDRITTWFVVGVAGLLAMMFGGTACRQVWIGVGIDPQLLILFGTVFGFITGILATLSVMQKPKTGGGEA